MGHSERLGLGSVALLAAFCILISGAVRYNLSVASSAISRLPATVIIDAGHGGEDGGTTGITGASESRLNLEISLRLEQIMRFCGIQTVMVRTEDTAIYTEPCETYSEKKISDLKNRVALADRIRPDMLISIHQNHFPEERFSGPQIFYAKTNGSRNMAQIAQSALETLLNPPSKRPCKIAQSVYLMDKIQCPGILVECGFLSNSREEALLQQPDYQKKIICALTCAFTQYIEKGEQDIEI